MNRKAVRLEVTPAEMRYLRETEGLTNKQIAERLDCAPATVYRYIGKRSNAVANAQAQNKPCPVPAHIATGRYEEEPVEVESTMEQKKPAFSAGSGSVPEKPVSTLSLLNEVKIIQLQGSECQYEVNTGEKTVTVKNGAVEVIMFDLEALTRFMAELTEISHVYIQ